MARRLLAVLMALFGCASGSAGPGSGTGPTLTGVLNKRPFVGRHALMKVDGSGSRGSTHILVFEREVRCEDWHLYYAPPPNPLRFGEVAVGVLFYAPWPVHSGARWDVLLPADNGTVQGRTPEVLLSFNKGKQYNWVRGEVEVVATTATTGTLRLSAERNRGEPIPPVSGDDTLVGSVRGAVSFTLCPPDPHPNIE